MVPVAFLLLWPGFQKMVDGTLSPHDILVLLKFREIAHAVWGV